MNMLAHRAGAQPTPDRRHVALGLSDDAVVELYYKLLLARRLSERTMVLTRQGRLDLAIPSDGHEAAQIGSVYALGPNDVVYGFYRSVPAALARGFSAREVLLDFAGKAGGPSSGGKNLPGHWSKRSVRMMTVSGSVATQLPHAVGSALAAKVRGEDSVAIVYSGDGGASKADFHEGLNFAAIHRLPVVFFCENNGYAISVPFRLQSAAPSVADRAAGYGIPGVGVDGMDVFEVYQATRDALARDRRGEGPTLIEARVYRYSLHTSQVGVENYRSPEEIAEQRRRDPVPRLRRYLEEVGLLDEARDRELVRRVDAEIDDAVEFAERSPYLKSEEALTNVLAGGG